MSSSKIIIILDHSVVTELYAIFAVKQNYIYFIHQLSPVQQHYQLPSYRHCYVNELQGGGECESEELRLGVWAKVFLLCASSTSEYLPIMLK